MKNNFIKINLLAISLLIRMYGVEIHYNETQNVIEFIHHITVHDTQESNLPAPGVFIFNSPAPFAGTTFIVTMPTAVSINQPFIIDYTIKASQFTHIPFWSDLIPDTAQLSAQGLTLIKYSAPTVGLFDSNAQSLARKGAKGIWSFNRGFAAGTIAHMTITLQASNSGVKKYTTFIPTNPPSLFGPLGTNVQLLPIKATNDYIQGRQNNSLVIPVLDNDSGCPPLRIISLVQPRYGVAGINKDNTITYNPNYNFVGPDSLTYTIEDALGNRATGHVEITIIEHAPASITL